MSKKPMCRWDEKLLDDVKKTVKKIDWQGTIEKVTYFPDGSSIRHCGGPCSDMYYDQYGEEC